MGCCRDEQDRCIAKFSQTVANTAMRRRQVDLPTPPMPHEHRRFDQSAISRTRELPGKRRLRGNPMPSPIAGIAAAQRRFRPFVGQRGSTRSRTVIRDFNAAARQAIDRRSGVPEYERRSRAGILRRRHGRGDLSRIRWPFVIARNSSFTYKGQAIDVKRIGRELGVR
jgi:hypothetical protein